MIKVSISVAFTMLSLTSVCQKNEAFTVNGRELTEGMSNTIKIKPRIDSLDFELKVSNGSISKGTTTSYNFSNGKSYQTIDSVYFWQLCSKTEKGFEQLYVNYKRGKSIIFSDTIPFSASPFPICEAVVFNSDEKQLSESDINKGLTLNLNIDFALNFVEYYITGFQIEIYKNRKFYKTLTNNGQKFSESNLITLNRLKNSYIKITNVQAFLKCGLKIKVKDSEIFPLR